jgi:hypothetical protein
MKLNPNLFPVILMMGMFTACESISDGVTPMPPQVQMVEASPENAYLAAQQAFKRLDFVVTHSSGAKIEAASAIHTSETFGNSRQLVAKVAIHEAGVGKSEVELWVTEETSSLSIGGTHRQPLKENGFYGLYFAMLQQVLQDRTTEKPGEKK